MRWSAFTAVLLGIWMLAAGAAPVSADELKAPMCPQETAIVGFPITPRLLVRPPAAPAAVTIRIDGRLPDGLTVTSDATRPMVTGTVKSSGTFAFDIHATLTRPDGSSEVNDARCTVQVKPAAFSRIKGVDRYDQSVQVSLQTFPSGAPLVYVASGEKFADALSASSVAADHDAPLLLVSAATATAGVIGEIERLRPRDVVVVGGAASVSEEVMHQLEAASAHPRVTRIGGGDRFAVSRNLIGNPSFGVSSSDEVYLATGATFPDALSASPAAARVGGPVLLIDGAEKTLTAEEDALLWGLDTKSVHIVGGPASVSPEVQADIERRFSTVRHGGLDRFAVSAAVNESAFPSANAIYLASATAFPDALSGSVPAGMAEGPLYITTKNCITPETASAIGRLAPDLIVLLGGYDTLSNEIGNIVLCPPS